VHPAGRSAGEQGQRLVNQIVIVEQATFQLFTAVVRGNRDSDMQQGFGTIAHQYCAAPFDQGWKTVDLGVEPAAKIGILLSKIVGHDRSARRLGVGQKHAEIFVDLGGIRRAIASTRRAACAWSALLLAASASAVCCQNDRGKFGPSTI
jgi:hypothetical protein